MKQSFREYLVVLVSYLAVGLGVTYPLILHFSTNLYGLPGDNYGTLWSFWWNISHKVDWIAPAQPTLLAAAKLLTHFVNEVAAYNLLLLLTYPLAGLAIYLIVHHFTKDKAASWLAGFIYIIGPYHIYQSYVHLSLAMIAWLPFYFYALLLWLKDPQPWRALLSGFLLALVILDNYYYGYLAVLLTIFFVIGLLIQIIRHKLSFWTALGQGIVAAGTAILLILAFIVPSFDSGAVQTYERPLRELFVFRAAWWDFFVPPITHPLVGKLIQQTTSYELSGSNYFERTLYLGYMPIFLAILGVWRTRKSWLTYLLLALLLVSILLATAPMPLAGWLHGLFPTFRVYSRFGLLPLMTMSILAGFGIATISRGTRSFLLHIAFALFVLIDFYPLLPSPMIDVTTVRPVEKALAALPAGEVVVYPIATNDEVRTNEYLSDSRRFGQPLFNGVDRAYQDSRTRQLVENPTDPKAINLLKHLGVRYVMIRKNIYTEGRLAGGVWQFYDPLYPKYLSAWNNGVPPSLDAQQPKVIRLFDDAEATLYQIN